MTAAPGFPPPKRQEEPASGAGTAARPGRWRS